MTIGEGHPAGDVLTRYRQFDPGVAVGEMPLGDCLQMQLDLQQVCADPAELTPRDRHTYGWLALETSLALAASNDPATGKPFTPKEVREASDHSRGVFRSIIRDENATPAERAYARIAHASVAAYHETRTRGGVRVESKTYTPYTNALHTAAKEMLEVENPDSQELELINSLAVTAVMAEHTVKTAYFLPASPRQPWHINGINRRGGRRYAIFVDDDAVSGMINISPSLLAHERLEGDSPALAVLAAYSGLRPGFGAVTSKRPSPQQKALEEICDRILPLLGEQSRALAEVATAAGSTVVAAAAEKPSVTRPEIAWYKAQSPGDLRNIVETTFLINLRNLEQAATDGELSAPELHALSWMRIDYGRILAASAEGKQSEADAARTQAGRVSQYDSPRHLAAAEAAEQERDRLFEASRGQFDSALESLNDVLTAIGYNPERRLTLQNSGDACEILLDIAAIPVYKALFAPVEGEQADSAVNSYLRQVTHLAPTVRDAMQRTQGKQEDQYESALTSAVRASLILLLTGASDESARHLVLPTGIRGGGAGAARGEAHAVVFPLDMTSDSGYDTAHPATVNFVSGNQLTHERQHIMIGMRHLYPGGPAKFIIPTLTQLARVVRSYKLGTKRQSHGAVTDGLALRISDAVADATN